MVHQMNKVERKLHKKKRGNYFLTEKSTLNQKYITVTLANHNRCICLPIWQHI